MTDSLNNRAEASIRAALEARSEIADDSTWFDMWDAACSPSNITALLAELDAARRFGRAKIESLIAERDAALARAEAAEADARRYEYLRQMADRVCVEWADHEGRQGAFSGKELDSLIDSALAQSTHKEEDRG